MVKYCVVSIWYSMVWLYLVQYHIVCYSTALLYGALWYYGMILWYGIMVQCGMVLWHGVV